MSQNGSRSKSTVVLVIGALLVVLLAALAVYGFAIGDFGSPDGTSSDDPPAAAGTDGTDPPEPGPHPDEAATTPPVEEIPDGGTGTNFELVGHNPLHDDHQYVGDTTFGIPRGSNGDITVADDCVYVGSLIGYQPPLIVDIADPAEPTVIGPVPDAIPGVGNGIEGIEASGDLLVIDHRHPLGGLGFDVPEGEPKRGLSVWDISGDCRSPELVTRYDYGDLALHSASLWRDPVDPDRVLAVQVFTDIPNIKIVDLTGCPDPDACDPEVVAEWALESQAGIDEPTHEAIMSTDGSRVYVAQYGAGVFTLDSSNLMAALREGENCDPAAPTDTPGEDHCLTALDPDIADAAGAHPNLDGEWQHTPLKVPDRPYLLVAAESGGLAWDEENGQVEPGTCPGASLRLYAIRDAGDDRPPGTIDPDPVGAYSLPEQDEANCGEDGWAADVAEPAWFSPHLPLAFPDIAFSTYYSAGFRAIDISEPTEPREAGHFFNEPVEEVRWASYGLQGDREHDDEGRPVRQPSAAGTHMFAFSYPVVHDGHVIYADVHSGLYILRYTGPHVDQIPQEGTCHPANPGGVEPGYEPCPPYGEA